MSSNRETRIKFKLSPAVQHPSEGNQSFLIESTTEVIDVQPNRCSITIGHTQGSLRGWRVCPRHPGWDQRYWHGTFCAKGCRRHDSTDVQIMRKMRFWNHHLPVTLHDMHTCESFRKSPVLTGTRGNKQWSKNTYWSTGCLFSPPRW